MGFLQACIQVFTTTRALRLSIVCKQPLKECYRKWKISLSRAKRILSSNRSIRRLKLFNIYFVLLLKHATLHCFFVPTGNENQLNQFSFLGWIIFSTKVLLIFVKWNALVYNWIYVKNYAYEMVVFCNNAHLNIELFHCCC